MLVKRLSLLLLLLGLSAVCAWAQVAQPAAPQQPPQILQSDKPVEREIAGGESHTYQIKLRAGQFAHVVVEQKGIDLTAALVGPDGKQLIAIDLTNIIGTRKPLLYQAPAAGNYQMVIRANGVATLAGSYQLRLELKDTATEQDEKRLAGEQLLIEAAAMALRMDFQQSIEKELQALKLWRELADRGWEGYTLGSMSGNYEKLSRYDKAAECFEQLLAIRREFKDRRGEAANLSDLGSA